MKISCSLSLSGIWQDLNFLNGKGVRLKMYRSNDNALIVSAHTSRYYCAFDRKEIRPDFFMLLIVQEVSQTQWFDYSYVLNADNAELLTLPVNQKGKYAKT